MREISGTGVSYSKKILCLPFKNPKGGIRTKSQKIENLDMT